MLPVVAGHITTGLTGGVDIPGALAVSAVEEGHRSTVEVKQMELLTTVAIVTGIAGYAPVSIKMVRVGIKISVVVLTGHVGFIIMAIEAKFLIRHSVIAAVNRGIIGLSGEQVKPSRAVRPVALGGSIWVCMTIAAIDQTGLGPAGHETLRRNGLIPARGRHRMKTGVIWIKFLGQIPAIGNL